MEVRDLPLDRLAPAPYNPRRTLKPDSPAYRKLASSLAAFGLVEPLVWNELTGRVVGGHARLAIWRSLGHATAPVSVVRLTEASERALNVVLNNQEAQGRYDPARLAAVLEDLDGRPEADLTGFDPGLLRSLKLRPLDDLPADEPPARVEVTLIIPAERFADVEPAIDALVREFGLASHVRQA